MLSEQQQHINEIRIQLMQLQSTGFALRFKRDWIWTLNHDAQSRSTLLLMKEISHYRKRRIRRPDILKADIDLKAPEIMEYRSTQRRFSTQNNHVPAILSVCSLAFRAVTVHLTRQRGMGGRGGGGCPLIAAGQADANQPAKHSSTRWGRKKRRHGSRSPSRSAGTSPCPALLLSKYNSQPTRRITAGSAA